MSVGSQSSCPASCSQRARAPNRQRLRPALAMPRSASSRRRFSTRPTNAIRATRTDLGIHKYDDQVEDLSEAALKAESAALKDFRSRLAGRSSDAHAEPRAGSRAADRQRRCAAARDRHHKNVVEGSDSYSSDITNAAYVIMKRNYAPSVDRLKALIAREKKLPATLQEARNNLTDPVASTREIAIEQIDGNISFFENDVPAAFADVTDKPLLAEFKQTNSDGWRRSPIQDVLTELAARRSRMAASCMEPRRYVKALSAREAVDLPLIGCCNRGDRSAEERRRLPDGAQTGGPERAGGSRHGCAQLDHPQPTSCSRQRRPPSTRSAEFITDHHIITIPPSDPARVKETPPFMRSTTSASMDTPGPFETAKLQAFYNMTLPDPAAARRAGRLHAELVLRDRSQRIDTRGLSRALHPVPLCERLSVGRPQGIRREYEYRRVGALLRADDVRRRAFTPAIRSTGSRSFRTPSFATCDSSSASRCTRRA